MPKNIIRTILVIGENHKDIIKKYSSDTEVEKYVLYKRDDAQLLQKKHLKFLESVLKSDKLNLTSNQTDLYKTLYLDIKSMDDFEYYRYITRGCTYDEKTGDAYSTKNPNAYYRAEKCYDDRLKKYGEEAPCANPFKLKDGTQAYSAKKYEIDWEKHHMYNTVVYESAWELVVDDREPKNDKEKQIKENMANRMSYFMNFDSKEEYVRHSCSFWTYGIATNDKYVEVDYTISDKDWVAGFYNKYIKPLPDDTLLTIYEVRSLSD